MTHINIAEEPRRSQFWTGRAARGVRRETGLTARCADRGRPPAAAAASLRTQGHPETLIWNRANPAAITGRRMRSCGWVRTSTQHKSHPQFSNRPLCRRLDVASAVIADCALRI